MNGSNCSQSSGSSRKARSPSGPSGFPELGLRLEAAEHQLARVGLEVDPAVEVAHDRQRVIEGERVRENGETILERPDDKDRGDDERLTQTHLEQVSENQKFRVLARFFESVRYPAYRAPRGA